MYGIPREAGISYARPVDPDVDAYPEKSKQRERVLAKTVQLHTCDEDTCKVWKEGKQVCKRRAPFELCDFDWIAADGSWGPERTFGYLNSWNPPTLQILQANNDVKLITNGVETKDISFYITNYAAKKQNASSGTSALLAKRLAFHQKQE